MDAQKMTEPPRDPVETVLADMVGSELAAAGKQLFQSGAVLDLQRISRSIVQARVAAERGRVAQVRLHVTEDRVQPSCSCGRARHFCVHSVAALFALEKQRRPGAAAAPHGRLPDVQRLARLLPPPPPAWSGLEGGSGACFATGLARSPQRPEPAVELVLAGGLPEWTGAEDRLEFQAGIRCQEKLYSAGNIARLCEDGQAAGGMRLDDFAFADVQLLGILHAARMSAATAEGAVLTGADVARCLDLMAAGGTRMRIAEKPARVARDWPEWTLAVYPPDAAAADVRVRIRPGVAADGRLLAAEPLRVLDGGRGLWLWDGADGVWRPLPGGLSADWVRWFVRGREETLTPAEWHSFLDGAAGRWRVPVRVMEAAAGGAAVVEGHGPDVLLYLDWTGLELLARMEFAYDGGVRLPAGPERPGGGMPPGAPARMRMPAAEAAAVAELEACGFERLSTSASGAGWRLHDPARIWDFWRQALDRLPARWTVFQSQACVRARAAAGVLRLDVQTGDEDRSWFELDCRLFSEQGQAVSWKKLAAAVQGGQDTVLVDGQLVHVPEQVRQIVLLLQHSQTGAAAGGNRLRFSMAGAPAIHQALGDRLTSQPAWVRLCRRLTQPPVPHPELLPAELQRILRGYQKDGIAWLQLLDECGFNGILADEMGLGKTIQALVWLDWRRRTGQARGPALVICPTSLMENWRNEARRFVPGMKTLVVHGLKRADLHAAMPAQNLVITSYALLRRDSRHYRGIEFDAVILDEAQHIKNPSTENARACKQLNAARRLILTGTPMENALHELWSLFDFTLPGYLGTRLEFQHRYEDEDVPGGTETARRELAQRLRPFVLRRLKAEVCQELPPKQEQVLYCEMEPPQARLYAGLLLAGRGIVQSAKSEGWTRHRFQALALLTRLRQVCCHPVLLPENLRAAGGDAGSAKSELLQELILETVDSGHRVVLFSQFTSFLKWFRAWLEKEGIPFEYLDGATSDRQARVDRFNRDASIPVFLLSLKAGGTGLNLTGADTVIHYDQWWNPMVEDQATDRTHRIGQQRPVTAIKLLVRNTVEEKIALLQQRKRLLFQEIMAGAPGRPGELTPDDLEFLLSPEPGEAAGPGVPAAGDGLST